MAVKTKAENSDEMIDENDAQVPSKEKKKKKKDKKDKKKKKGGIFKLIFLAVIFGLLIAVLVFNAGDIREKYLRNYLEKIPVVKNMLPEKQEEENADEFSGLSREELASQIRVMNEENKSLEDEKAALNDEIKKLNDEMKRLQEIEANQLAFNEEKEEFDRMIAENDPEAYSKFYESIEPETAESIYREIAEASQSDDELKQYVQTFEGMKKDAAAKVLEEMMGTDMELVVQILNNISSDQRGDILSSMEAANAAACARQMAPQ